MNVGYFPDKLPVAVMHIYGKCQASTVHKGKFVNVKKHKNIHDIHYETNSMKEHQHKSVCARFKAKYEHLHANLHIA